MSSINLVIQVALLRKQAAVNMPAAQPLDPFQDSLDRLGQEADKKTKVEKTRQKIFGTEAAMQKSQKLQKGLESAANEMEQDHRRWRDLEAEQSARENPPLVEPPPKARVGSALAVGGTGTFRNRPSATAPTAGPAAPSPALARSRVIIEPQVTNTEALQAMARRAHHASDHVAESLEFVLWEGTNAAGLTSVPVELLEVGGLYRIRFADLVLGLGLERDIRILAFSFQEDESVSGAISVAAEVWRETATP